jgi:protein-tyrosine phosphatase
MPDHRAPFRQGPHAEPQPGPGAVSPFATFLQPVPIDDEGRLWLAPACDDWGPIVRQHHLTAVFDLEEDLDHGIPAHPDRVIYVYFPITDDDLPTLHKLHAVARLGAQLMRNGERVLVHCQMGLNRSALLAGLMMVYNGTTGRDAIARLQERRPGALYNRRFAAHLEAQPAGGNEDW